MAPKVIEKPKISFVPTWKDTDIKKNPKYASSNGADDDALDITKLKRRKSKAPESDSKNGTTPSKDKKKENAGNPTGKCKLGDDISGLDEEELRRR